jgi:hypothetical protein
MFQQRPRVLRLAPADQRLAGEVICVRALRLDGDGCLEPAHRLVDPPDRQQGLAPDDAGDDGVGMVLDPALAQVDGALGLAALEERPRQLDEHA